MRLSGIGSAKTEAVIINGKISYLFALAVLLLALPWAGAQEYYDEINDKNGRVYPHYREVYEVWSKMTGKEKDEFLKESKQAFRGDNALDAMPRVIPHDEYDRVLKAGVRQRALAIQMFLQDHYSGVRGYAKAGVIPAAVVARLIERNRESGFDGKIPPSMISFMYGPDIIRDRNGVWRVIEDNPGFIGGLGDLKLAQDETLKAMPEIKDAFAFRKADWFYRELAASFKERAREQGGRAIVYMLPPYPDQEDERFKKLMREQGIETVTNRTQMRLKIAREGVFVFDSNLDKPKYEKVGFVFLNGEHSWLDPSYTANRERLIVSEAEAHRADKDVKKSIRQRLEVELARSPVDLGAIMDVLDDSNIRNGARDALSTAREARGLTEAILKGRVTANYTPGLDFIGDKEFYLYVEKLIEHYLGEKPILRNIATRRMSVGNTGELNAELMAEVLNNIHKYVVKKVDGRGGDAVWVGPKVKRSELKELKARIAANPSEFIVQEFTPLSRMGENIVDMRVIADVSPKSVLVTDTPWGRGLPASGNGKVNLSDKGREITIFVRDTWPAMCRRIFSGK